MKIYRNPIRIGRNDIFIDLEEWKYLYQGEHRLETPYAYGSYQDIKMAFIYEPDAEAKYITGVSYHDFKQNEHAGSTIRPVIYGSDNKNQPDIELWSGPSRQSTGEGWVEVYIPLAEQLEIGSYDYYWIIIEITNPSVSWSGIGADNGPSVSDANLYNITGSWVHLSDMSYNQNWLIECLVSYTG